MKPKNYKMPKQSPYVKKTVDMVTGAVGIRVAGSVAAGVPGLPGTILSAGAMPLAATSMLGMAGEDPRTYGRRRKK